MTKTLIAARKFILNEFLYYVAPSFRTALADEINRVFDEYADDEPALRDELLGLAEDYYDDGLDAKLAIHELFD